MVTESGEILGCIIHNYKKTKNKLGPGIWGSGLFLYLNVSTFCSRRKRVKLSLSTGVGSVVKLMSNSVFYESHHPSGFAVLYCRRNRSSSISEHHYEAIIVKWFPCLTMRWAVRICALREISHLTQVPQRLEWKHCWVLLKDFCIFVCQRRPLRPEVIVPVTVVTSARWQGSVLTCPLAHNSRIQPKLTVKCILLFDHTVMLMNPLKF